MADQFERGEIEFLNPAEQLIEIRRMIENLNVTSKVCFDHAGNYWRTASGGLVFSHSYEGYQFPEEKETLLARIEQGITDQKMNPDVPGIHHFL